MATNCDKILAGEAKEKYITALTAAVAKIEGGRNGPGMQGARMAQESARQQGDGDPTAAYIASMEKTLAARNGDKAVDTLKARAQADAATSGFFKIACGSGHTHQASVPARPDMGQQQQR